MPGGGVTKENVKYIIENTDCNEIHGSFKTVKEYPEDKDEDSEVSVGEREGPVYVADESTIAEIVNILRNV